MSLPAQPQGVTQWSSLLSKLGSTVICMCTCFCIHTQDSCITCTNTVWSLQPFNNNIHKFLTGNMNIICLWCSLVLYKFKYPFIRGTVNWVHTYCNCYTLQLSNWQNCNRYQGVFTFSWWWSVSIEQKLT